VRHTKSESASGELRSRGNAHEAKFIAALAAFLLRQGYAPSQITVLAPYCGQLLLIKQELRQQHCADVITAGIDQYHGEENDIVLLSLVRSNDSKSIGGLGVDSRVAVALSRARLGLYMIGNAEILQSESKLWATVLRRLEQDEAVGDFLPLLATRAESGRRALVRSGDDFEGVVSDFERRR